jgi:hypothetical protein
MKIWKCKLFSITRQYVQYYSTVCSLQHTMRKEICYLFLKLNCYLRFQNPIRIFYSLEHIFAANLELELWSLSEAHWTTETNVLHVSFMFYFRNIYFGKLEYIPAEIPNFIFSTKRASNFATRDDTVKFWMFRHKITLRRVSYNRKKMHVCHVLQCFSLSNLQVELLWWRYSMYIVRVINTA